MRQLSIYCDKCGKSLDNSDYNRANYSCEIDLDSTKYMFDLCSECSASFISLINSWLNDDKAKS